MKTNIDLMLIEDNQDHAKIIERICSKIKKYSIQMTFFDTLEKSLEILERKPFDAIILDLNIKDSRGIETLKKVSAVFDYGAIIVVTSLENIDLGEKSLNYGAQDFITKDNMNADIIERAIIFSIERKRNEKNLQNDLKRSEYFIRALAHDFSAPMRQIDFFNKQFRKNVQEKNYPQAIEDSQTIQSSISKLENLLNSLVNMTLLKNRIQKESFSASDIVSDIVRILDKKSTVHYSNLPNIYARKAEVFLVFMNLIDNAIKFSSKNLSPMVSISAEDKVNSIEFCIKDNGIGIPSFAIASIFKEFEREKSHENFEGFGVGLSLVSYYVKNNSGTIKIESEPGKGTTVFVSFPKNDTTEHN